MNGHALKLEKRDTIFTNIDLYEWVDKISITQIIKNRSFDNRDDCNAIYSGLKKIKKNSKNQNYIVCKYHRDFPYGRVFPDQYSYINMPREVRHSLAYKEYIDIDIVNCIPTILYQIAKTNKFQHIYIEDYVKNRESKLNELKKQFNMTREEAKLLVITIINSEQHEKATQNEFLNNLLLETNQFANMVVGFNETMKNDLIKYKKSKRKKKDNIKYSLFCQFLFEYENFILEHIYTYLIEHQFIKNGYATLCYDGIMIKKPTKDLDLKDIEKYVYDKTKFNINLTIKGMNKIQDLENNKKTEDEIDIMLEKCFNKYAIDHQLKTQQRDDFNISFFQDILGNKTYPLNYTLMKKYFLKHFIMTLRDNMFYKIAKKYKYSKRSKTYTISHDLVRYDSFGLKSLLMKNAEGDYISFLDELLKEPYKKFDSITFDPIDNDNNYYNIFDKYGYQKIIADVDENDRRLFQQYLDYLKVYFCDDNDTKYQCLIDFLANIIQDPDGKTHQSIILYSSIKGCGKSSFGNMIREVIGLRFSYFGNNSELRNSHSTINEFRFFVFIDEFKLDKQGELEDIKRLISAENATINKKFKDIMYDCPDYCRYMFAVDKSKYVKLDRNHRRFDIFKVRKITNDPELKKVINKINTTKRNVIAKLFGEFLINHKIEYDWIEREKWADRRVFPECHEEFIKTENIDDFFARFYEADIDDEIIKDLFRYKRIKVKNDLIKINSKTFYDKVYKGVFTKYYIKKTEFKKALRKEENYFIQDGKSGGETHIKLKLLHKFLYSNRICREKKYKNHWEEAHKNYIDGKYINEDDECQIESSDEEEEEEATENVIQSVFSNKTIKNSFKKKKVKEMIIEDEDDLDRRVNMVGINRMNKELENVKI